jgi:long-chain acyl-CoA synthetase
MTLAGLCLEAAFKYKKRTAFEMYREGRIFKPVTYWMMGLRARQIGALLGEMGTEAGDRVMILSENRPEWPLAYFGIALAGAVSVPVLTDFPSEQIQHIAEHAGITAICLSRRMEAKLDHFNPAVPRIFIDSISGEKDGGESIDVSMHGTEKELTLHKPAGDYPRRRADDLASIIYTSGTSGNSKGVMLSHRNLIFCAKAAREMNRIYPRDRLLSVIPLAHTYECTLGLLTVVMNGAMTAYLDKPPSPSVLLPAMQTLRPTAMITVPLFIEKMYRSAIAPALKKNPLYRFAPTRPLALMLAGKKLMSALGGSVRFFGIGGAPLSAETEEFLRRIKFPYAPGYGLTETAPLLAGTSPYHFPSRSAGSVFAGIEIRIANETGTAGPGNEGEIQVKGPNVMLGYYRDEERTRKTFTADRWLRTGDLGYLDSKGNLFIKGRLKSVILGPSGENIYPEEIEGLLNSSELVEDALVCSGEKGELVAMIHISEKAKAAMNAIEQGLDDLKEWVNKKMTAFSRLNRIVIREEPFEKTPTQKIKRFLYHS